MPATKISGSTTRTAPAAASRRRPGRRDDKAGSGSGSTGVFYTVLRSAYQRPDPSGNGERLSTEGVACRDRENGRSLPCYLFMDRVAPTRAQRYVDRPPKGHWSYRIGMSANWLDDQSLGDLMLLSEPVSVRVG